MNKTTTKQLRLPAYLKLWLSLCLCLALYALPSGAQTFEWVKGMGGSGPDWGQDVAVDGTGNVYVTGFFSSATADFNPGSSDGTLSTAGADDVYLAKYDADGNYLWAKSMGGSSTDRGMAIAVDGGGNVYVTGVFNSAAADFNPGGSGGTLSTTGGNDVFLAKYDPDGNYLWAKSMGGSGNDQISKLAVDGSGNVYISGGFRSDTANFNPGGSGGVLINAGLADIFLAKYDMDGSFLWAKSVGSTGNEITNGITVDGSDNVYVTGSFGSAAADFNPGGSGGMLLANWGNSDGLFLTKYDADGNFVWVRGIGGTGWGSNGATSIATDENGNIYAAGRFQKYNIDFYADGTSVGTLTNAGGGSTIYLAKFDTDGNYIWAKAMGGGETRAEDIAVDAGGNVYLAGDFTYTVDFNPPGSSNTLTTGEMPPTTNPSTNAFLAKYDADGGFRWVRGMGGDGIDYAFGLALDHSGNVYGTGYFNSETADFNPGGSGGTLTTTADPYDNNVFLVKFGCSDTSSSALPPVTTCEASYTWNDSVYTITGTYTQVFPNISGCDSTVSLELTLTPVTPLIAINEFVLSTTESYATYQWFLNGEAIPGATDATYTVTENGDYTVTVTNGQGCSGTSDVYKVTNATGIGDMNHTGNKIKVYPNPAKNILYINSPVDIDASLSGVDGRVLQVAVSTKAMDISGLASGVYLLRLTDKEGNLVKVEKVVKE